MIKLVIGPYRTGKTGIVLNELVKYKLANPFDQCLVLVPSQRYGRLLRQQLAEQAKAAGAVGIFGLHVATIYEAASRILAQAGMAPNILPTELCVRTVADSLRNMKDDGELVHLASIHDMPGTAASVLKLIDEFERAAIAPSAALKKIDATASAESRHRELALVYKKYWERLDEFHALDQKRAVLACRDLLSKKTVAGLNVRFIVVDGFDRISPLQAEFIDGLSQHAVQTHISFDYITPERRRELPERDDEYSWKDASYNELKKRLRMDDVFVQLPGPPTRPQASVFSALDAFAECQEAARRCKAAVVERGVRASEILVVAREINDYSAAISLCFKQAGLPFYIDTSAAVSSVPWIKALQQMLELAANDFPRRGVIDVLRCNIVASEKYVGRFVDRIEKESKELIAGLAQWKQSLAKYPELAEGLEQFFKTITPPQSSDKTGYCRWLEDVIDAVFHPFSARRTPKHGYNGPTFSEADLQALAAVRAALKTIVAEESLFGKHKVSFEAFVLHFRRLLHSSSYRSAKPSGDSIHACSCEQAPNRRFDEVFVLGAIEGQFPKHSVESGFTSSDERAKWRSFELELNNPRQEPGYEKALFVSLIERARKRFHISFPRVNLSGDELFPSFYLADGTLAEHCAEAPLQPVDQIAAVDFGASALACPVSAAEAVFGWLWRNSGYNLPEAWATVSDISEYWQSIAGTVYGAFQRHAPSGAPEHQGRLGHLIDAGAIKPSLPTAWSVSALNAYGQCPFKYWVQQQLKIEPVVDAEPGLDVKERGTLYHRVLEIYYSRLLQLKLVPPEQVYEEHLRSALDQAFDEWQSKPFFHPGPYWQNTKNEFAFRIANFLEFDCRRLHSSGRVPALFEASFGRHDSKFPALTWQTSHGEIKLRGVIDRIDVEQRPDGIRATVIDYKSGSANITADSARAGANMQLPVYARAVEQTIMPGCTVDDGIYLAIQAAKGIGTLTFREGKTSDVMDCVSRRIDAAVAGVATANFAVEPYDRKACNNCDSRAICRIADLARDGDA